MSVRGIWMKMKLSLPFEQLNYHVGCLGSWSCFETSKERKIELRKEPETKKERIRCEMPHGVQLQSIQSVGSRLSGVQLTGTRFQDLLRLPLAGLAPLPFPLALG